MLTLDRLPLGEAALRQVAVYVSLHGGLWRCRQKQLHYCWSHSRLRSCGQQQRRAAPGICCGSCAGRHTKQLLHNRRMPACCRSVHHSVAVAVYGSYCLRCSSQQQLQGCAVAVLGCHVGGGQAKTIRAGSCGRGHMQQQLHRLNAAPCGSSMHGAPASTSQRGGSAWVKGQNCPHGSGVPSLGGFPQRCCHGLWPCGGLRCCFAAAAARFRCCRCLRPE